MEDEALLVMYWIQKKWMREQVSKLIAMLVLIVVVMVESDGCKLLSRIASGSVSVLSSWEQRGIFLVSNLEFFFPLKLRVWGFDTLIFTVFYSWFTSVARVKTKLGNWRCQFRRSQPTAFLAHSTSNIDESPSSSFATSIVLALHASTYLSTYWQILALDIATHPTTIPRKLGQHEASHQRQKEHDDHHNHFWCGRVSSIMCT